MGWAHNFKPPGGPGNGPPKGDSVIPRAGGPPTGKKIKPFEPGNKAAVGRPNAGEGYRAVNEREKAAELREHLYTLAKTADHQMTQVRATEAYLNRVEGMPVARTITATTDDLSALDDSALDQRRSELERKLREASAGAAQETDAAGS